MASILDDIRRFEESA